MLQILIVDDEPRQRRGLAALVRRLRPDWVVLEAANGQEALDTAQQEALDAVLSDIRMPTVDGFALGERLRALYPHVVIGYVSAYEDFQYAAQALRLGAVEYLLKPYTAAQVDETLRRLSQNVTQRQITQRAHAHLDVTTEAWREQRLLAWLSRPLTPEEAAELARFAPVNSGGYVLHVRQPEEEVDSGIAEDARERCQQLRTWLSKLSTDIYYCSPAEDTPVAMGVLPCPCSPAASASWLNDLLKAHLPTLPAGAYVGTSSYVPRLGPDAELAHKQAQFAASFAFYEPYPRHIPYETVQAAAGKSFPYMFRYEQQLLPEKLKEASPEGLQELLSDMFAYVDAPMRLLPDKLVRHMYQLYQSMLAGIENRLPQEAFARLWADGSTLFAQIRTYRHLVESFHILMREAILAQNLDRSEHTEVHIQHCISYIQAHFAEPLTLSELGERFYFSPNYLSALIKNRTGVPFKQFLQTLRMQAALTHLQSSEDRVSDIAQAVGFPDPAYFNRIFKKQYGLSPDTYRRNMKSQLSAGDTP